MDYYQEMTFVWLEAEGILRDTTGGARGLDDFLRAFHGGPANGPELKPYDRADLVAGLNAIAPYHGQGFFATRVDGLQPRLTTAGLEAAGWRVVYTPAPTTPRSLSAPCKGLRRFRPPSDSS